MRSNCPWLLRKSAANERPALGKERRSENRSLTVCIGSGPNFNIRQLQALLIAKVCSNSEAGNSHSHKPQRLTLDGLRVQLGDHYTAHSRPIGLPP